MNCANIKCAICFCLEPKAKDLGIIWVVILLLIPGFFVWSMLYQLPPTCYPFIFPTLFHTYILTYPYIPSYLCLLTNIYQHMSTYHHLPLPIPKYRYIIAADTGTGIGLVVFLRLFVWSMHYQLSPTSYPLIFPS